jgi:hypothetical protein
MQKIEARDLQISRRETPAGRQNAAADQRGISEIGSMESVGKGRPETPAKSFKTG